MELSPKNIAIAIIVLIFVVPGIFHAQSFMASPSDEKLAEVVEDAVIPWELNVFVAIVNAFENHPYILIGALILFGMFLRLIKK